MEINASARKERDMGRVCVKITVSAAYLFFFLLAIPQGYAASNVQTISKADLRKTLDDPGVIIIDVRVERAWKESDGKIKGAVWENPDDVEAWTGKYSKDKTLVLYCS
jgi:hypothetical protein